MNASAIKSIINRPKTLLTKINYRYPLLFKWMSDEQCLKFWYKYNFGKKLDLENPKTFNEKLQWLKMYDRKPIYTTMVDKYEAKQYVADKIGEEYIIPTLGVWDSFDDIDFDKLPDQFVLKCTHDSGGLVICRDKSEFDKNAAKRKINRSLKRNFYWVGREWPYKDVKPRIIAEKYMSEGNGELQDYKIHNFGGVPKIILVCSQRFSAIGLHEDFYNTEWEKLDLKRPMHLTSMEAKEQPAELEKMLALSSFLTKDLPFARTDFYSINGKLYFGEITFFPASGFEKFVPDKMDFEMGNWIKVPYTINR